MSKGENELLSETALHGPSPDDFRSDEHKQKGDAMTVAEFIDELQEDYAPDVQVESIHMKTSDGMIYFYGATSFTESDGEKEEE